MSRTARLWKGLGIWTAGGLVLSGFMVRAAEPESLTRQLTNLGRQALDHGQPDQARTFLTKALSLDPTNAEAKTALSKLSAVRLASYQDPAAAPAPAAPALAAPEGPTATIESDYRNENVRRQAFTSEIRARLGDAKKLVDAGRPDEALTTLRFALNAVQTGENAPDDARRRLENEVRTAIRSTEQVAERAALERADQYVKAKALEARARALEVAAETQNGVSSLLTEFDALMDQGRYLVFLNAGAGDIDATTAPFTDARDRATKARAKIPGSVAPRAAIFTTDATRFLAQSTMYEQLKEYRFMLSLQDVDRAAVPFPDTKAIEFPLAAEWVRSSEKRIKKYANEDFLLDRDDRTKAILSKLDERISMAFPNETPLDTVIKYIKSSSQDEAAGLPNGIPIYVDPIGLQEADKTLQDNITLDLEGVPLKVTLRLILKQLELTYTVKDGLMTITSEKAEDQPTEIRVYYAADLAMIPFSLMGGGMMGGGMGGMGGGMGGMGGGMGGMGGGMGGMGGGMGGMGGGMGGGFMSMPVQDPSNALSEKKSN